LSAVLDAHVAVSACGAHEFLDAQAAWCSTQWLNGKGGEDDRQVGVDRFAFVVVDRSGLQVVLGHPEAFLDAPQPVVRHR